MIFRAGFSRRRSPCARFSLHALSPSSLRLLQPFFSKHLSKNHRPKVSQRRVSVSDKTGPEAITLLESGEPIALMFSDIVMPGGMTGYDVVEWVRSMRPDVKVLLTSGYSDVPLAVSKAMREIKVLGKPCTREQLACALRAALDGRPFADGISLSQQS